MVPTSHTPALLAAVVPLLAVEGGRLLVTTKTGADRIGGGSNDKPFLQNEPNYSPETLDYFGFAFFLGLPLPGRCVRVLVQQGQNSIAWRRRQWEYQPFEAQIDEAADVLVLGRSAEERQRELLAAKALLSLAQLLYPAGEVGTREIDRQPSVAIFRCALEDAFGLRSEQDGRSARLHGLRIRPDRVEVHELAVELGGFLGPDFADGEDFFLDDFPFPLCYRAVIFHLLDVPSAADSEHDAPAGDHVERSDFLCQRDRIALDNEAYARAQLQLLGNRRNGAERDEWIMRMPVLLRQISTAREGRLSRSGNMGVLGKPQRLEVTLLGLEPEFDRLNRVVSRKHRNCKLGHD